MTEHELQLPEFTIGDIPEAKQNSHKERVILSKLLKRLLEQGAFQDDFQKLTTNAVELKFGQGKKQRRFAGFDTLKTALEKIQLSENDLFLLRQTSEHYPALAKEKAFQPLFDIASANHASWLIQSVSEFFSGLTRNVHFPLLFSG